jgi:hypothetical protein
MRSQRRGGMLLELRNQAGFVRSGEGTGPTRTCAWHEGSPLLPLCQIAVDGTAVQAKLGCDRANCGPLIDGADHAVTEVEMIGAHAGLLPLASIAPSQRLRKTL